MSITPEETIKILTAKAECMRRETSGIDIDCNYRNCDECDLCYKQGTTGDQMEALRVAISALQAQDVPDTNVGDMVSRQKAIDAIVNCTNCGDEKTLRAYVQKHNLDNGWIGGILEAINAIEDLPSAQPEIVRCKDCKWYELPSHKITENCVRWMKNNGILLPIKPNDYCSYAERRTDG